VTRTALRDFIDCWTVIRRAIHSRGVGVSLAICPFVFSFGEQQPFFPRGDARRRPICTRAKAPCGFFPCYALDSLLPFVSLVDSWNIINRRKSPTLAPPPQIPSGLHSEWLCRG
jgi:hypothetical protein